MWNRAQLFTIYENFGKSSNYLSFNFCVDQWEWEVVILTKIKHCERDQTRFLKKLFEGAKIMHILGKPDTIQVKLRVSGWRSVGWRITHGLKTRNLTAQDDWFQFSRAARALLTLANDCHFPCQAVTGVSWPENSLIVPLEKPWK